MQCVSLTTLPEQHMPYVTAHCVTMCPAPNKFQDARHARWDLEYP